MIPKSCKRLIEVDFPISEVSRHSAREKSIRHGHPSTLHLWWARRPLAACRAVLMGLLFPDPCDPHCPPDFKDQTRSLLSEVQGRPGPSDEALRKSLLKFIGDFANWDLSAHPGYLKVARGLVKAAHPEESPLVVDPFAGGGSIPLEALRLGCEAFASDLNPVACLIQKVLLEDIPRHGLQLAKDLREAGAKIKAEAEKELSAFYPIDPDGSKPIAYLWARTVSCEAPGCGAEIPLMRSFWLSKKARRKQALRYRVIRAHDVGATGGSPISSTPDTPPTIAFEVFEPQSERDVPQGTVSRAKARCLACGAVLSPARVRAQLSSQRGGADVLFDEEGNRTGGARLLAVVTLKPRQQGRFYRVAEERDYEPVFQAIHVLERKIVHPLANGLSPVPDEPLPRERVTGSSGFRVMLYGMTIWGDLFTARQKLALISLARKVQQLSEKNQMSDVLTVSLALSFSRCIDRNSNLTRWDSSSDNIGGTFARQSLPIVWDFAEVGPLAGASGDWEGMVDWVVRVANTFSATASNSGQTQLADACTSPLPDASCTIWFTDPPYYDNVAYADLSDFFFVWLKRVLIGNSLLRDPFDSFNPLTPKAKEIIRDPARITNGNPKDIRFFEEKMASVFAEGHRVLSEDGISCVVFAHKTTEGWEALLSGMLKAGWTITASWPIKTEMGNRPVAHDTASLATSVHLICSPRHKDAGVGDWAEVRSEMEQRVREWMARLLEEGIRGADAIFACIGPALEVFSRYERVETPAGHTVPLGGRPEAIDPHERGFLTYIFEAVSHEALRQVLGDARTEGFEEDARLTALFLWTIQQSKQNGNGPQADLEDSTEKEEDEDEEDEEEETGSGRSRGGIKMPFDTLIRITRPMDSLPDMGRRHHHDSEGNCPPGSRAGAG